MEMYVSISRELAMKDIVHVSPAGGRVLDCAADDACEPVACEICLQELPESVLTSDEAADYVQYFFGLECLELWRRRAGKPTT